MMEKNYAGLEGFIWWMGVVESRHDPLEMGRCKVRVYGWHSPSLADIPSDDLPWAIPVHSLNSSSFATAKEGDMVFGFFADGRNAQVPLIVGIIPAFGIEKGSTDVGFNDLRDEAALAAAPKKAIARSYSRTGAGSTTTDETPETYPKERDLENPSVTALARNRVNETHVVTSRKERGPIVIPSSAGAFPTPEPSYNPVYPYNQAMETESGHSLEFDDTPGAERVELAHRTGTMFEIQPNGTKVEEIVKDNYTIVMADDYVYVMGKAIVSVDKDCTIKVAGNLKIDVGGDFEVNVAGETKFSSAKDFKLSSAEDVKVGSSKKTSISGGSQVSVSSQGTASLSGTAETRVSSVGIMAVSGLATSITSVAPITASKMSVAGSVSSTGIGIGDFFNIPAFPALPALPTGILDFAAFIPGASELLAQVNGVIAEVQAAVGDITALADGALADLTALTDVQSLMGKLDVGQLGSMLEQATGFDVENLTKTIGGEFGIDKLTDTIDSFGAGQLVSKLGGQADAFADKLLAGGEGIASKFMSKIPTGQIKAFTDKLGQGKVNELITKATGTDVNKFIKGMAKDKIKDTISSLAPPELRSVVSSLDGGNLRKTLESLGEEGIADFKNKIGSELGGLLADKLNQTVGYPIIVDGKNLETTLASFTGEDLKDKVSSKLKGVVTDKINGIIT